MTATLQFIPGNEHEMIHWRQGSLVAGVDEAGRGSLAGPVVAAAVIFPKDFTNVMGCRDSKTLQEHQRNALYEQIQHQSLAIGIGIVDNAKIDEVNIRNATLIAMTQALEALEYPHYHALIDGNFFRHDTIPFTTIIKGDHKCFSIAAASIIAKVTRDRIMKELEEKVGSLYYFAKNKGYGTVEHRQALLKHGPSSYHRLSFLGKILSP